MRSGAPSPACWPTCARPRSRAPAAARRDRATTCGSTPLRSRSISAAASSTRARTCSTSGWSAPRWSITPSARGSLTAASPSPPRTTRSRLRGLQARARGCDRPLGRPRASRTCGGSSSARTSASPRRRAPTSTRNCYEEFQRHVLGFIDPDAIRPMPLVLDGGNGMAGPMAGPLLDRLGITGKRLYFEPNGAVPRPRAQPAAGGEPPADHRPVRSEGAELGIAWDGDADRCFFIDDTGEFVPGDFLTALLAESMLEQEPGAHDPLRRARQPRRPATSSAPRAAAR